MLEAIVVEHVKQEDIIKYLKEGKANNVSFIYNGSTHLWELRHESFSYVQEEFLPEDLEDLDYKTELIECLDDEDLLKIINEYEKDVLVKEWSTRGHSQGDYVEGIAYVTKDRYEKIYNEKENWKEDCAKIIDDEVKSIGMWMWGDVKGYVLEKKVAFWEVAATVRLQNIFRNWRNLYHCIAVIIMVLLCIRLEMEYIILEKVVYLWQ